jgi:hypothetical protein
MFAEKTRAEIYFEPMPIVLSLLCDKTHAVQIFEFDLILLGFLAARVDGVLANNFIRSEFGAYFRVSWPLTDFQSIENLLRHSPRGDLMDPTRSTEGAKRQKQVRQRCPK